MYSSTFQSLPCCYFPTKTVVVDDDKNFLETFLHYSSHSYEKFTDPQHALSYLLNYAPEVSDDFWLETDLENDYTDRINEQALVINIKKMKKILSNLTRFEDISVVIIDYKMPFIDGLTLLNKLKSKPFKKILLTGQGDSTLGVKAFNEGLIDYFLPKDQEKLFANLNNVIENLKNDYFFSLTKSLYDYSPFISTLNKDENFKKYFLEIIDKLKVSEFYLNDLKGCYLFLNDKKKYYLVTYSEEEISNMANIAEQDGASRETVYQIKNHLQIPFFGPDTDFWKIPGPEWHSFLHPINVINSINQKFYCSIIEAEQAVS